MQDNRINWVDYAKAAAIYSVVLLHVGVQDPYKGIVRAFLIPLFFFLSGIFSKPEKYKNYFEFFRQKGVKILIPYFFFNTITYLFWLFIGRHYGLDSDSEINPLRPLLGISLGTYKLMQHYVPLWFLACLFSVESIFYLVFKNGKSIKSYIIKIVPFVLLGYLNYTFNPHSLPWGIDIALTMIVFYAVGNLSKEMVVKRGTGIIKQAITLLISFSITYLMYRMNDEVKVFTNYYGNYLYFFIGAFSGIIFTMSLFRLLESISKPINFLLFVGKNTLVILALHLIASSFLKAIMVYVLKVNYTLYENNTFYTLTFSTLCIVVLIPAIFFIDKYLPFIVGKKRPIKLVQPTENH